MKFQSAAASKHNFQQLVFNRANQMLNGFFAELKKLAKYAFGVAAQTIFEQLIYLKMPPHLEKSINHAHWEIGTFVQIVLNLEKKLELKGLWARMNFTWTLWGNMQQKQTPRNPNWHVITAESQANIELNAVNPGERNTKVEATKIVLAKLLILRTVPTEGLTVTTKLPTLVILTIPTTKRTGKKNGLLNLWELRQIQPLQQKMFNFGANAANRPPPGDRRPTGQNQNQRQDTQNNEDESVQAAAQTLN